MKPDTNIIQSTLAAIPEIAACYLFGSAAKAEAVVNDIDLLILVRPDTDIDKSMWAVIEKASAALNVPADLIDVLVFDLSLADPHVLYRAVNEGVLLKNDYPDLLSDRIEALSMYLLENEHVIKEARRLAQELVEEACKHGCKPNEPPPFENLCGLESDQPRRIVKASECLSGTPTRAVIAAETDKRRVENV